MLGEGQRSTHQRVFFTRQSRTGFILRAVADRARVRGRRGRRGRPQLEHEAFVENLVAMLAAAMSAPLEEL